jgi:hypothetical protein
VRPDFQPRHGSITLMTRPWQWGVPATFDPLPFFTHWRTYWLSCAPTINLWLVANLREAHAICQAHGEIATDLTSPKS